MNGYRINYLLLLASIAAVVCLGWLGLMRLHIDTDVVKTLPNQEQVITDALEIFKHHPIHDQVAVDVAIDRSDPDTLVRCGLELEQAMRASGLFAEVGMLDVGRLMPGLTQRVVEDLPLLLTQEELEHSVVPRLTGDAIRQRLQTVMSGLSTMEGIGQAGLAGADPLGLRDLVLAKLQPLAPSAEARLYRGQLISRDGRHLLLIARPVAAGTDTALARRLTDFFAASSQALNRASSPASVTLTPAGGFRAALDNEEIIRHDVQLALGLTTVGIALLLLVAFPRPAIGLLCLLPAVAGTAAALFLYSLFHDSISIMVLGFSGALISIMDDHSITYLLFLDRPKVTRGAHAAREAKSIGGGMALITTVSAFLVLSLSDFPVFAELGQFTALGFVCTYLFIHAILPRIFPEMPSAADRVLPLHRLADRLFSTGRIGAGLALALMAVLLVFAKPEFRIDLSAMNTVSEQTRSDEQHFAAVWGQAGAKVYLMTRAASAPELQAINDRILAQVETDRGAGRIEAAFVPSMLFPGEQRGRANLAAWRAFWTAQRVAQLQSDLTREGTALGFSAEGFAPFFARLGPEHAPIPAPPPRDFDRLLGISAGSGHELIQFLTLTPGPRYDAPRVLADYGRDGKLFDPGYFSKRLGETLFTTFATLLAIIAAMVSLLLFLQFLDWRLTLIALTPLVFAFICTLGTLKLIGHPLDIPGLMLAVVILGMGDDYAIFTVRGCQWYGTVDHPSHVLVRSAVLMAAASTLIGFGVLCFAEHATLKSIGITSLCGIGYALLGTFVLLPPLLRAYFRPVAPPPPDSGLTGRILHRYRLLEAYPRMFARFKLKLDPLFAELPALLARGKSIRTVLDIGCGYGVPACWLLEQLPEATVIGLDPDPDRIRVAGRAAGERGTMTVGAAPELPQLERPADAVLLLDMSHYLDQGQLALTLERAFRLLAPGGLLILRFVSRPAGRRSIFWYVEEVRIRLGRGRAWYRDPAELVRLLDQAGLIEVAVRPSHNRELSWLVGQKPGASAP